MRVLLLAAAAACATLVAAPALASPIVVKDGRFTADVSAKEMSRVSIAGEKISSVRKMDDPSGPKMMVEADASTGDVFVAFDGEVTGRSFSAFLITDSGRTVQAVFTPKDKEAQTVLVSLPAGEAKPALVTASVDPDDAKEGGDSAPPPTEGKAERREAYPETLTALIRLMFNGEQLNANDLGAVQRVSVADHPQRAGAFEMRTLQVYTVSSLRGTVLNLRNLTKIGQPVSAKTFLVRGVLAAAVSHENIDPGQSGRVYLVEEAQ